MIYFITHVTKEVEVARLPYITHSLEKHFPGSELRVLNQTNTPLPEFGGKLGEWGVENIKSTGFGWTLRFLRMAERLIEPGDLVIKIDPDIDIRGNPLDGIEIIPSGACFGQVKLVQEVPVFLGGFQGFSYEAVKLYLEHGPKVENQPGPQDIIAYSLGARLGMKFISLPWVDLWAEPDNHDPNCKILSWRSR